MSMLKKRIDDAIENQYGPSIDKGNKENTTLNLYCDKKNPNCDLDNLHKAVLPLFVKHMGTFKYYIEKTGGARVIQLVFNTRGEYLMAQATFHTLKHRLHWLLKGI